MKLNVISNSEIKRRCKNEGLVIAIGPYVFRIRSSMPDIHRNLGKLYGQFELAKEDEIVDFNIQIDMPYGFRRFYKPQVDFKLEGYAPFLPLPATQAFPILEWGMNWCIAQHTFDYLSIHAATIEKNGFTAVLPAESGSGKSTLTAIMVSNGWRLLSDEMTLISLRTGAVSPISRPISLKNRSIEVVKAYNPEAIFSNVVSDTNKGTIGHMKSPDSSIESINKTAEISAFIFPKYEARADCKLSAKVKGEALLTAIDQSFNYDILGEIGFKALTKVIEQANCYDFKYSSTQDAVDTFEALAQSV